MCQKISTISYPYSMFVKGPGYLPEQALPGAIRVHGHHDHVKKP